MGQLADGRHDLFFFQMVLSTKVGQLAAALEAAERKGTMVADSNNQLEQHLAESSLEPASPSHSPTQP